MKYITIPKTAELDPDRFDDDQEAPTFLKFMLGTKTLPGVLDDFQWGKPVKRLRRNVLIVQAFKKARGPGDVVSLEDDDHETLVAIMLDPTKPYAPIIMRECMDYILAVEKAPDKDPRAKKKDLAAAEIDASDTEVDTTPGGPEGSD